MKTLVVPQNKKKTKNKKKQSTKGSSVYLYLCSILLCGSQRLIYTKGIRTRTHPRTHTHTHPQADRERDSLRGEREGKTKVTFAFMHMGCLRFGWGF